MVNAADLVGASRLLLCVGAGGVGKTTTAAALGFGAARRGRRVAVLTVDPARRLAGTLGLQDHAGRPVPVPVEGDGELWVEMLDAGRAWDDLVARELDEARAAALAANRMYRAVSRRFVQSHDFVAVERVHQLLDPSAGYDLVIVDTPPSRRASDFLQAPEQMAAFFSNPALGWFTGTTGGAVTELTARPFRAIADRVLGTGFIAELIEFFSLLQTMAPGFAQRSRAVNEALRSSASAVTVTTTERTPLRQLPTLERSLSEVGVPVAASVVNRVGALQPVVVEPAALTRAIDRAGPDLDPVLAAALGERMLAADRRAASRARSAHEMVEASLPSDRSILWVGDLSAGSFPETGDELEVVQHMVAELFG